MLAAVNWTGAADGVNWATAGNWSTMALPTSADDVTLGTAASIQLSATTTVKSLTVGSTATLIVGNSNVLNVTGGVTDNGVIKLGAPTNSNLWGAINFLGTQTLGGTGSLQFNASTNTSNAITITNSGAILTIGSGVTINGSTGQIKTATSDARIINQGTIVSNVGAGTLTSAGLFTNSGSGTLSVSNGGRIILSGTWDNTGTLSNQGGIFTFGGTFNGASVSGITTSGATSKTFGITGALTGNLNIPTSAGAIWQLAGGSIINSTITSTGTDQLRLNAGTLNNATIAAGTTVTAIGINPNPTPLLQSTNGLTVNGTLQMGTVATAFSPYIYFMGTQTLGGTGEVLMNAATAPMAYPNLLLAYSTGPAAVLTIGPNLTLHGAQGYISAASALASVVNQGTIISDVAGTGMAVGSSVAIPGAFTNQGTIRAAAGGLVNFTFGVVNQGVIDAAGGTLTINSYPVTNNGQFHIGSGGVLNTTYPLSIGTTGYLVEDAGGTINFKAAVSGATTNIAASDLQGSTAFSATGTTAGAPQSIEVMSQDLGATASVFSANSNFVYGSVTINTPFARLNDASDNSPGAPDAMYARSLIVAAGTQLDLNGLHLYTQAANIQGTVVNGTVTVVEATTTTALAVSSGTINAGQSVTLTATVLMSGGGAPAPASTVSFYDGVTLLGTATSNASGIATFATSSLTPGSHALIAEYAATATSSASASSAQTVTVNGISSSVALATSSPFVLHGSAVTLTATVTAGAPATTGTITFLSGATVLGTASVNASGIATLTTSTIPFGTHNITASYGGDAMHNPSVSVSVEVKIGLGYAYLGTTLAAPSVSVGGSIVVNALIGASGAGLAPTGTVTIYEGSLPVATGSVSGAGVASISVPGLSIGEHTLTALYSGDSNYFGDASTVPLAVVTATGTLQLSATRNIYHSGGSPVTLTASLDAAAGGTGSVSFLSGAAVVATATVNAAGQAVATWNAAPGTYTDLTAVYTGSLPTLTSAPVSITIYPRYAVISSNSSANNTYGSAYTQTITVLDNTAAPATGTVTFFQDFTPVATVTLNGSGVASYTGASTLLGRHFLSFTYNGNATTPAVAGYPGNIIALDILPADTVFNISVPTAYPGQSSVITAQLASSGAYYPTGTVEFFEGGTSLGTAVIDATGKAVLSHAFSVGSHPITGVYLGDGNFNGFSSSFSVPANVVFANTNASLTVPATSGYGSTAIATISVTTIPTEAGPATGTVELYEYISGSYVLHGTGTLDASGIALINIPVLAPGSHAFTMTYTGDATHYAKQVLTQRTMVVQPAATTLALNVPANIFRADSATLTATLTPASTGPVIPAGQIAFYDGAALLGYGTLDSAGNASFVASGLTVGSHSITATFAANSYYAGSASSASTVNVNKTIASTTLSATPATTDYTSAVTLTATTATIAGATPTGIATFYDGVVSLGSATLNGSGIATFTVSAFTGGTHGITVSYSGDANYTDANSNLVNVVINATASSATLDAAVPAVRLGDSDTLTFTVSGAGVTPTGSVEFFDGAVSLGVVTLADGVAALAPTLAFGTHSLSAVYSGDSNYLTTSAATSVDVTPAISVTTLDAPADATFGDAVALVATTTSAGTPTGTIEFFDGSVSLGVATLDGYGIATLNIDTLGVGTHAITTVYSGDTQNDASTSAASTLTIGKAGSATTLDVVADSTFGDSVTLSAAVSVTAGIAPTGSVTFFDGTSALATIAIDGAGLASFTTSAFVVGSHSLTAVYNGNGNYLASPASDVSTLDVAQADSATTLAIDPASADVAVTPATLATGVIEFFDGSVSLGSAALDLAGHASLETSFLAPGVHAITASYGGDASYLASASQAQSITITQTTAIATLAITPSATTYGQSPAITASITTVAGVAATGDVTLHDGSIVLAVATLDASGNATFTLSSLLGVGTHSLSVSYDGDVNYTSATDDADLTVAKASASAELTLSTSTAVFGNGVTLTATITTAVDTATGTVEFFDGSTSLGTASLDANGIATLPSGALSVGTHNITTAYSGDGSYNGATSTTQALTVTRAASSTLVDVAASSIYGESVTLTIAVSTAVATPTGTVELFDGSISLGTATLDANGIASFNNSALEPGTHSITAAYSGDGSYNASTSSASTLTIAKAGSATQLTADNDETIFGQSVTFTATVTASAASGTLTGSVEFFAGAASLGVVALDSGSASLTIASLAAGTHSVTAVYSGDAHHTGGSDSATQIVGPAQTSTTLAAPDTIVGSATLLSASVATLAPGSGVATGLVEFFDGSTSLGTASLAAGTASLSVTLAVGSHSLTAAYAGDSNHDASASSAVSQTVSQATSSGVIASNFATRNFGQSVTFTATFSLTTGSAAISGNVEFFDGSTSLGTAAIAANGVASLATTSLNAGAHAVSAVYSGNTNIAGATTATTASVTVNAIASSTSLTFPLGTIHFGDSSTLTATINTAVGSPTGTVTLKNGATVLATAPVVAGVATFDTSAIAIGDYSLTATYSGDTNHLASTSGSQVFHVIKANASIALTSDSPTTTPYAQIVTLTATLAGSPTTGTPTGSVTYSDNGTTLGTVALNASGVATFALPQSTTLGTHVITATYSGDAIFYGDSRQTTQQIVAAPSTTTLALSGGGNSTYGSPVTLTASVDTTTATTGTVWFFKGATYLGSGTLASGQASISVSNLAAGTHNLTAQFLGGGAYTGSTSAAQTLTVAKETPAVTVDSVPATVYGQSTVYTATVPHLSGTVLGGSVTFYVNGVAHSANSNNWLTGVFSYTSTTPAMGDNTVTATYSGDANYNSASSAAVTHTVNKAATSLAVTANGGSAGYLDVVILTAQVDAVAPGTGTRTGTVEFFEGATSLGTGTVVTSGSATVPITTLSVGTHNITAVYTGDSHFEGSTTAASYTLTINPVATTLSLAVSNATPNYLSNFDVQAQIVTASGVNVTSGTVEFFNGATSLGTATTTYSGIAYFSSSSFPVGSYDITAIYTDGVNYNNSTAAPVNVSVQKINITAAALNVGLSSTAYGQTNTAWANVYSPAAGPATGTVTFYDGATALGTLPLSGLSTGSLALTGLSVGSHSITAVYNGDSNYNASGATAASNVTIAKSSTTTSVAVTPTTAAIGTTVTISAAVTRAQTGGVQATGTVTFFDGATNLGTATLDAAGAAFITRNNLTLGAHTLTAVYNGDSNYNPSPASPSDTLTITPAATSAALTLSNATINFNSSVTLTATITSTYAGTIGGTVTFYDGVTVLGTGTLNASGQATYTSSTFTGGTHNLTVAYAAAGNYAGSTSAAQTLTVNKINAATTLTVGATSASYGQAVSLSATVTASGPTPTGTVTFYDGANAIVTIALNGSGVAAGSVSNLSVATHSITAIYNGNTNLNAGPQTTAKTLTITKTNTTIALGVTPTSAQIGTLTTFTATVSRAQTGGNQVTGTVSFKDGGTIFATVPVDANGIATYSRSDLSIATHNITAIYNGDSSYNASANSSTTTVTTTKAATTSAVTLTASSVNYLSAVTLTATITSAYAGPVGGTVTFKDGSTTLGTATLNANGQATFTKSNWTIGSHSITVVYAGNTTYLTSTSPAQVLTVNKLPTTSTQTLSATTANFGTSITMTAQMTTGPAGWPSGNVTFYDAGVSLGNANLNNSGRATLSKNNFTRGTHSIYYIYNGNTYYLTSTSNTVGLTIV